jgi:hypothetical protein
MAFNPSTRPAVTASGGEGDTPPLSPTITHYQQVSETVDGMINEVLTVLPKLELPHPRTVTFVRGHKNIPVEFMETAIAGVARNPELQGLRKLNVATGQDTIQLNQAFRPLADKLYHFAKKLEYTLDTRLAVLAAEALQVYYLVKGMARDPEGAAMLELVADLKRDLGPRGGRKSAKPKPEQEPGTGSTSLTEPPATIRKKRVRPKKVAVVTSL